MKKTLVFSLLLTAVALLSQTGGNLDWTQIRSADRQGNGTKGQSACGSTTNGHAAAFDSTGCLVDAGAAPGTGTVTSFSAGNLSPLFTSSVANPTTTPALSFSLSSQSQNLFYASPNGSSGSPAFRAIVNADLPGSGSITANGQTCTLGSTCNVNSGATAHGLALNQGNGNAITGLVLGAHQTTIGTAASDPNAKTIPDCTDTGGNHLNFTQSTDAFSCGTSGSTTTNLKYRVCQMDVGADNGSALADADLGPQGRQCFVPYPATVVEVTVTADAGTPNVIPANNHAGSASNLVSAALATAASGGIACSNVSGTTGIDGVTTCSATLQNTSLSAGDWIQLTSGTAGGTAKRMSISVTYSVTP